MLNAGAAAIFGIHEVENKDIVYLCRHTDFHDALRSCLHGDSAEMTLEQNGRVYAAYMHPVLHPERADGEVTGAVILLLDRTEKRRAEEQRRRFSADVSHELKTPLTTISALSEMLAADLVKQEDIRDFARKISGQSRRLINIINDIIRLSEFDEGKIDRSFRLFDLWELAHSVLVSLREKAERRKIRLELRGERLEMLASERMIDELLYNLVDNAIQYNVSGGEVVVFLALQHEHISISVADTGIGIAAEHQDRVFERFYRVDHARSQGKGGTGLGLAIAKHIVEHHGGTISLDSGETGTTIRCCFRACP
jgi:two-component system phosphate regulon sensor histidine kinase PhoR